MSPSQPTFGMIRMRGGRYEAHGLPLAGAEELRRYERLVVRTARSLYMRAHPKRKRAPRGFPEHTSLRLTAIDEGSVVPVLERHDSSAAPSLLTAEDYFDEARLLINSALKGLSSTNGRIDPRFPADCLKEFANFGRSLQAGEAIEFSDDGTDPAVFNKDIRTRLQTLARLDSIEVELVVQGQITGLRSSPQQFDFVMSGTEKKLVCNYIDAAIWNDLKEFQGFGERAPMTSLSVVAEQSMNGEIISIIDVLAVEAALPADWAKRIEELSQLGSGWLYPDTPPPSSVAIDAAEQFMLACVDEAIDRPGIFPTPGGGVQLEWSRAGIEVEVEFMDNGSARGLWISTDTEAGDEQDFTENDIDNMLNFVLGGLSG
ncbi:hypothetical protein ABZX12_14330 [Kribbella sp. NPDC003505]|uniref:hypothetical protein n=1 Tax=Kribbella sp. NPDC003505 TaxID=3154448 RepID=UPI0033B96CA1